MVYIRYKYRICIIEPRACRSSGTTERTMRALPKHVPDPAIAGNSILALLKFGEHYSRGTFFLQFLAVCTAVLWSRAAWHSAVHNAVARGAIQAQRVILIGDAAQRSSFARDLSARGINVVASLDAP